MATKTSEIRERLAQYLSGDLMPEQFEGWLASLLCETCDNQATEKLALAVEWEFCDYHRGSSSLEALRLNLEGLALGRDVVLFGAPIVLGQWDGLYGQSTSGTSVSLQFHAGPGAVVGQLQRLPETVSV